MDETTTDQPTWTVDEDGTLWWGPVGDGSDLFDPNISGVAYAALVQHVRDAHRLHDLRESIAAEAELVGGEDHRYTGTAVAQILRALLVDADEAAVLALAANEGENDG